MFDPLDEIKSRIDIVDLVSQYVVLKKSGRNFKGLCPFHKEKTPSFMVSPDKQIAYCFGCHKGGDIFRFFSELEGVDFQEALRTLAKRAGVTLQHQKKEDISQKEKLYEINEKTREIFSEQLFLPEGKQALQYLHNRGLSDEDIKTFSLGYASDSYDSLYKKLLEKGYDKKDMVLAGVAVQKEFSQDSIFDRFRHRAIFPIHTIEGETVAFGGRALDDSQQPKYLNSADTPLYNKSYILYNLDKAKESIREKDFVLVVEGYMDAISVFCHGIKNVVAVCGTALTEGQVKLLKRYTKNIYFCFDGDTAGVEAMKRNAEPVIKQQLILKTIPLETYKDPDEYMQKDKDAFLKLLEKPVDFMDFLMTHLGKKYDVSTIEGRRSFLQELFPLLSIFPFKTEQDLYIKKVADTLHSSVAHIENDLQKARRHIKIPRQEEAITSSKKSFTIHHYLLGFLILHPSFFPVLQEKKMDISFPTDFLKNVYNSIENQYNNQAYISFEENSEFNAEEKEKIKILKLLIENEFGEKEEEHKNVFLQIIENHKDTFSQEKRKEQYHKNSLEKFQLEKYQEYLNSRKNKNT